MAYSKKSPHNNCRFSGVVTDDPENFALYKAIELDVFEKNIPPIAEVTEDIEDKPKKKKRGTSERDE